MCVYIFKFIFNSFKPIFTICSIFISFCIKFIKSKIESSVYITIGSYVCVYTCENLIKYEKDGNYLICKKYNEEDRTKKLE